MNVPASGNKNIWPWLIAIAALLNVPCLFNDVLEPDGALYASIAKQIALSNNWSNLYVNGQDWLDKPHFPFWAAAASFRFFGINAFAYKLPSFLCFIIGLYYTYRLTLLLFKNETTAGIATVLYATALHTVLANFDVRAEGYLTAFVCAATFYLLRIMEQRNWRDVFAASLFCALAVMTKGIFIFLIIFSGFVLYWLMNKQWKQFLNPVWYIIAFITLIFILPELLCLWLQFDSHPEKIVFGKTHVSGIRFFFWDSQFGRFFNSGPIKGSGDVLFFLHTSLWAYLPWSPVLVAAVVFLFKKTVRNKMPEELSVISGSTLFGFLLFSFSKFQLPHYIVTLFPYFSIITASYLCYNLSLKTWSVWNSTMTILFAIVSVLVSFISFYSQLPESLNVIILVGAFLFIFTYLFKWQQAEGLIIKGVLASVVLSLFLNNLFYPKLLQYQSGMTAAKWLTKEHNSLPVIQYKWNSYAFTFYNRTTVTATDKAGELFKKSDSVLIYCSMKDALALQDSGIKAKVLFTTPEFHVSTITADFLHDKTRDAATATYVIAACTR